MYDTERASLRFLLDDRNVAVNVTVSDYLSVGMSLLCSIKSRSNRTVCLGTPCFILPKFERKKKGMSLDDFYFRSLFSVR